MLEDIEQVDGELYVIGFWRNSDLIVTKYFVAKYAEGKISEPVNITKNEYEYYNELLLNKIESDSNLESEVAPETKEAVEDTK